MKTFLQFISGRDIWYRNLNLYCSGTQLRLNNVFSITGQLIRSRPPLSRSFRETGASPTPVRDWEALSRKHLSVKVNAEDQVVPGEQAKSFKIQEDINVIGRPFQNRENVPPVTTNIVKPVSCDRVLKLMNELGSMKLSASRDKRQISLICHQLYDMELNCNAKDYIKLLYYLSRLNAPHEELILKVVRNVSMVLDDVYKPNPLITSLLKSIANLLVRETNALHSIVTWYCKRMKVIDLSDAAEAIHTLAILNYFPAEADILLQEMKNSELMEYSSSLKYLNFVWAVTLLDRAEEQMIESVLAHGFRKKVESVLSPEARRPVYLKLNNIYAYASMRKLSINSDTSLFTFERPWLLHMKERRKMDPVIKSFIDGLANLLPHRTFNTFVESDSGCIIDAVCTFDVNHNPITELEFVRQKSGVKLAIIILGFKDLCFPNKKTQTGIIDFHRRLLEGSGYQVLFIPFKEFPTRDNIRVKSDYLRKRINSVLPNFPVGEW